MTILTWIILVHSKLENVLVLVLVSMVLYVTPHQPMAWPSFSKMSRQERVQLLHLRFDVLLRMV